MKNITALSFVFICFFILQSCENLGEQTIVSTVEELNKSIESAEAGDHIVMANGTWKDVAIKFQGEGTTEKRIVLRAETNGEVFIEGVSNFEISGKYLEVRGLFFRNGYSPTANIIAFRTSRKNVQY